MTLQRRARQMQRSAGPAAAGLVGAVAQRPARPSPKPTPAAGREGGAGSPATGLRSERDLARQWQRRAFDAGWAQGRERERIAAGLHDDIGQTLSVAALKLGELQLLAGAAPAQALIAELRQLLGQAIKATRSATFELRACEDLG